MDESPEQHSDISVMCVDVYGLRIGIRTNELAVLACLPNHLPYGWTPCPDEDIDRQYSLHATNSPDIASPRLYVLAVESKILTETSDLQVALRELEFDLEVCVAESSPNYVFVHAGVVGWRDRAILLAGRSFSGKSTLVAALVREGATYYSDEYALLDREGRVRAFPRPLRLRADVRNLVPVCQALGHANQRVSLPVGLVAFAQFQSEAVWDPLPLTQGEAILGLLANTMSIQRRPQAAFRILRQVFSTARAIRGTRGEACETAGALLRLTDESTPPE